MDYKNHLLAQTWAETTKKQYYKYYKKLIFILEGTGREIDEEVVEVFVGRYNNSVCRAFLKDYLSWLKLAIPIPKKKGRKARKVKNYITPLEIKKIGNWLWNKHADKKFYLMLYLTYECALRRKEIVNIRWNDFDWADWKSKGNQGVCRLTISERGAKGQKSRQTLISEKLAMKIYKYIKLNRDKIQNSKKDTLFRVTETRWHQAFKNAVRSYLKRDYTLHELRFSRATYWHKEKGFDIMTIKKLLGHSDISTTQIYIDPEQESALKELEKTL